VILFGQGTGPLKRIAAGAAGGTATDATTLRSAGGHRWPQFLPDGRHFILTEGRASVLLGELDSMQTTELLKTDATVVYSPPGVLLYVPPGSKTLMAQPLDPKSWRPVGDPQSVVDQVGYASGSGYPPASTSAQGILAYWEGTTVSTAPGWFDRKGNRRRCRRPGHRPLSLSHPTIV
jgi:hypothetical protein